MADKVNCFYCVHWDNKGHCCTLNDENSIAKKECYFHNRFKKTDKNQKIITDLRKKVEEQERKIKNLEDYNWHLQNTRYYRFDIKGNTSEFTVDKFVISHIRDEYCKQIKNKIQGLFSEYSNLPQNVIMNVINQVNIENEMEVLKWLN